MIIFAGFLGLLALGFVFVERANAQTPGCGPDNTGCNVGCGCQADGCCSETAAPSGCADQTQSPSSCTTQQLLAWGSKVSPVFRSKVIDICQRIGIDPDWLMSCMAFESANTFSPSIINRSGSGAVGLIQFLPSTAQRLGTTVSALQLMSAEDQLDFVELYLQPYSDRLQSLSDVYMAILWPSAIGKDDSYVLFSKTDPAHVLAYAENKGLDFNADGQITKGEAASPIAVKLEQGAGLAA